MAEYKFENKSAEKIAEDILAITSGPGHVDAAFKALKSLEAAVLKDVVNKIEKILIEQTADEAALYKQRGGSEGADEMVKDMEEIFRELDDLITAPLSPKEREEYAKEAAEAKEQYYKEEAEGLVASQSLCQTFNNVAKIRGDEAHPVIKAIVKELSMLSEPEYNDTQKLEAALISGYEKGVAPPSTAKPAPQKKAKKYTL